VAGVAAAVGVAACGGGEEIPSTITTDVPGSVSVASTAASSTPSTAASTPSAASTAATTQPTRVPAVFTLKGSKLTPKTVSVPAFLEAQVTVTTTDARAHTVVVKAGKGYTVQVPPRGSATVKVPGQKAGSYEVQVDGKAAGTLSWGGEPGP
jgi:Cupredoxin-like domain